MQDIPKYGLDPPWSRPRVGEGTSTGKKKRKARERRSHVTTLELRYSPHGKLKRSLEIKAETNYLYQVKFKYGGCTPGVYLILWARFTHLTHSRDKTTFQNPSLGLGGSTRYLIVPGRGVTKHANNQCRQEVNRLRIYINFSTRL